MMVSYKHLNSELHICFTIHRGDARRCSDHVSTVDTCIANAAEHPSFVPVESQPAGMPSKNDHTSKDILTAS